MLDGLAIVIFVLYKGYVQFLSNCKCYGYIQVQSSLSPVKQLKGYRHSDHSFRSMFAMLSEKCSSQILFWSMTLNFVQMVQDDINLRNPSCKLYSSQKPVTQNEYTPHPTYSCQKSYVTRSTSSCFTSLEREWN